MKGPVRVVSTDDIARVAADLMDALHKRERLRMAEETMEEFCEFCGERKLPIECYSDAGDCPLVDYQKGRP